MLSQPAWAEPLVASLERSGPSFEEDAAILEAIRAWVVAVRALHSGRPELYAERAGALVQALEQHGQLRWAVLAELKLEISCAALGADARAMEAGRRAIERAERMNLSSYAERARSHLVLPLARQGDLAGAEALARATLAAAHAASDRVTEARARVGLAAVRWLASDPAGAAAEARQVLDNRLFSLAARVDASAILARSLAAQNDGQGALSTAEQGLALAADASLPVIALRVARVEALDVLGATHDKASALAEARTLLMRRSEQIADAGLRAAFLSLPEHRALLD